MEESVGILNSLLEIVVNNKYSSYWLGILHMFDRKKSCCSSSCVEVAALGKGQFLGTSTHPPPPRRSLRAYLSVMSKFMCQEWKARSFTFFGRS